MPAPIVDERNIWGDEEAAAFVRSVAVGDEAMVNPPATRVLELLGR